MKDNQVNNKGLFFYPSDKKREIKECDLNVALVPKLEAERSSALWLFSYVSFPQKMTEEEISQKTHSILEKIAKGIGLALRESLDEMYDFSHVASSDNEKAD